MKTIKHTNTELILKDSAGCFWMLGLFFVVIAGIFIAGLSGLFHNNDQLKDWEKIVAWIISLSGFFAGIWFIYVHPDSVITINKNESIVTIHRKGLIRNDIETYMLDEIKDIIIAESSDSDGDPVFRTELSFKTGKKIPLSLLWIQNKDAQENTVKLIKEFLIDPKFYQQV